MERNAQLSSPLGDQLLFWRMTAVESLGRLFEIELDVLSLSPDIRPESLLGKPMTISFAVDEERKRHFNGYATRFSMAAPLGRYFSYRISLRPWLWFLSRTSDCKVFQSKSVPTVLDEVFSDEPSKVVEKRLSGDYANWVYCVQYRETDFAFTSRLMEQEGIYYYFEHGENKHTLMLCDSPASHDAIDGDSTVKFDPIVGVASSDKDHISTISFTQEIQPGVVVMREYDFTKPSADLTVKRKPEHTPAYSRNQYEVYDYPGAYDNGGEGDAYASVRAEELAAQMEVFSGSGNERDIAVGRRFKLTNHPVRDLNIEYLVTATNIRIEEGQYESGKGAGTIYSMSFTAIRQRQRYRPNRVTAKPLIQGVQTAIVTGPAGEEIHTDAHGRVKIQFHWDRYGKKDENSSCFVRVAYPMAGKGWGITGVPRIGHEVVVTFEEGDPDRPLITGSVFNGENPGPFGTPAKAMVSGVKTNTHKGKGYNELAMDDTAGNELVRLHAQFDMDSTIEHDDRQHVLNNRTITVDGKHNETIDGDTTIKVVTGNYDHDIAAGTAKYHVQKALTETYDDTQTTTIAKDLKIVSTGGPISIESASKKIHIKAETEILLECGESTILLKKDGTIKIKGKAISIDGSDSVNIHGAAVRSTADMEHETKGNIVKSEGTATNTVKGGMVMLNP